MNHPLAWLWGTAILLTLIGCAPQDSSRTAHVQLLLQHDEPNLGSLLAGSPRALVSPVPGTVPGTVGDFACLALNIMGTGIAPIEPNPKADTMEVVLKGSYCSYPGVISPAVAATSGGLLEVSVPTGAQRVIQILGISTSSGCAAAENLSPHFARQSGTGSDPEVPGIYEVARALTDIYQDMELTLKSAYDPTMPKEVRCNPGAPANQPPTISSLSDQSIIEGNSFSSINFTIADLETVANLLTVSATSSNTTLIPNANILISGTGASKWLFLSPAANQTGSSTITVSVTDGINTTSTSFVATVSSDGLPLAEKVLGQTDFISGSSGTTASTMNMPIFITTYGTHIFVGDRGNNRVLIWNSLPAASGSPADTVLGQPDFISGGTATSANGFQVPGGIAADANGVAVADVNNNRILAWRGAFPTTGANANTVFGQIDFTSGAPNSPGPFGTYGAQNLYQPSAVALAGDTLFATDETNHRVLIYNNFSTLAAASAPANVVLGQSSLTSTGTTSCNTTGLYAPRGIASDGTMLVIADDLYSRVLVYNSIPTSNNAAPDFVLGQPNFTSCNQNQGGSTPTASTLNEPIGVALTATRLYVADSLNKRVLYWNRPITSNGQAASGVIGQIDFTSYTEGTSAKRFKNVTGVAVMSGKVLLADPSNNRVLIFAEP